MNLRQKSRNDSIVVTVDVGGTNFTITVFRSTDNINPIGDANGKITQGFRGTHHAFDVDFNNIASHIREFSRLLGPIEAIAIAIAGKLDDERATLLMAGNLTHWVGQPVKAIFEEEFGCRVVLGNDAEAASLADAVYGLCVKEDELKGVDFIGIGWGSGIGGTCVRYVRQNPTVVSVLGRLALGKPMQGKPQLLAIPGEPGHIPVGDDNGIECGCGQSGCLESYCGGNNLEARLGMKPAEMSRYDWGELVLPWMIRGLHAYLRVQPVKVLIFHGGVACKQDWMLDQIQIGLKNVGIDVRVYKSYFGTSAGALGALSLLSL